MSMPPPSHNSRLTIGCWKLGATLKIKAREHNNLQLTDTSDASPNILVFQMSSKKPFVVDIAFISRTGLKNVSAASELDNAARRSSYADPHTLGRRPLADVRLKLKKKDPNLQSPSEAKVYYKSRKRKPGRKYKSNSWWEGEVAWMALKEVLLLHNLLLLI